MNGWKGVITNGKKSEKKIVRAHNAIEMAMCD